MLTGITIKSHIGMGDGLQFSSLPENYYRSTGERLVDLSKPWFFDYNPFVLRDILTKPAKTVELWNYSPRQYVLPRVRPHGVYLSNAEIYASVFKAKTFLNRPRLYEFENAPFENREMILLHTRGKSHGLMPKHVVEHVLKKYGPSKQLFSIGTDEPDYGIPKISTPTFWDLALVISQARMLIGVDSGPSWIAACYPDVVIKKLRTKPSTDALKTWVPLAIDNVHSHWDDRCHQIFNVSDDDIGFTYSFRKL